MIITRELAREVFKIESEAILNLSNQLSEDFDKAVKFILSCSGKLIVSGMGKSGIIGKKIAATLASTGTPSFYLHPAEAYHGDLGMIESQDIVLLISNSGETDEVLKLVPFLKSQGNITISMTGNSESTLAKNTNYHLDIGVDKEACPMQLAPTSSTTATLVMGDALAVALMKLRGFQEKDFAQFHLGGSLGKRLLCTVEDVMREDALPVNKREDKLIDVIHQMTSSGLGLSIICEDNRVIGLITDGDLRKSMEYDQNAFFSLQANDIMTSAPKTVNKNVRLVEAQKIMENEQVNSLLVINQKNELLGVVTYKSTM